MDFAVYQKKAHTTAVYPTVGELAVMGVVRWVGPAVTNKSNYDFIEAANKSNPYYPALGLAGEVGEYCNKLKKVMRDQDGMINQTFVDQASGELGDVLWYLSECATSLGLDLGVIAESNIEKLFSRKERGVLGGAGDDR